METSALLQCRIRPGMFSDEYLIELDLPEIGAASFFVPREAVIGRPEEKNGRVRVRMFAHEGRNWAVLPTEHQEIVPVSESNLVAA